MDGNPSSRAKDRLTNGQIRDVAYQVLSQLSAYPYAERMRVFDAAKELTARDIEDEDGRVVIDFPPHASDRD